MKATEKQKVFASKINEIYTGKVAEKYDFSLPNFFSKWKKMAFKDSSLKLGDKVLVFCCGTGLDFPHILKRIGEEGKIVGVDFSPEMLKMARKKIVKNNWKNIKLIEADITRFENKLDEKFDICVCTLGMSIIPDYKSAYYNLLSYVKEEGEIIIGDMQLASGSYARFNQFTIFLAKKFGGTYEGHNNSNKLCALMEKELIVIKKREFFFKSYFYFVAKAD